MLLSLPLAWLLVRYPNRALRWLHSLIDIPYTLPRRGAGDCLHFTVHPPVTAAGYQPERDADDYPVCVSCPLSDGMPEAGAQQHVATGSGHGRSRQLAGADFSQRLRHIVLPLLAPAAFAGALLVFLTAVNELTVSALLWSAGKETLGVVIF